jgi:hypothetical protein
LAKAGIGASFAYSRIIHTKTGISCRVACLIMFYIPSLAYPESEGALVAD